MTLTARITIATATITIVNLCVFFLCAYRLQTAERKIDVKDRNMGY